MADSFADRAADEAQLDSSVIMSVQMTQGRTTNIQKRLCAVLERIQCFEAEKKRLSDLDPSARAPPPPPPSAPSRPSRTRLTLPLFLKAFIELGHKPFLMTTSRHKVVACSSCKQQFRKSHFKNALQERCAPIARPVIAIPPAIDEINESPIDPSKKRLIPLSCPLDTKRSKTQMQPQPSSHIVAPLLDVPPTIGKVRLHASHTLEHRRGVVLCLRCGFYSVTKVDQLALPCKQPNINGKQRIARWGKGLTPRIGLNWPQQYSDLQEGIIWRPTPAQSSLK